MTGVLLAVPLVAEDQTIGLLHFDAAAPDAFHQEHVRLAHMVGEQVAVAIREAQLLYQAQRAEEKFRTLVHTVDAIVWEADPIDFAFTFVSPQAERWLGYPLEQWLHNTGFWPSRIHPEDSERVMAECARATRSGIDHQLEYRVVAADGRILWLRDLVTVEARDGMPLRLRGIMFDITERRQAVEALQQSNAILQATQESAADGICLVDDSGNVISFNQRFAELWEIPADEVKEVHLSQQLMAHVLSKLSSPDEFLEKIHFLYDNPDTSSRDEVTLLDGRIFERHSAPARSPQNVSYGRVWSFSDITERKQYEQQLAHQAFHDPVTKLPNRALLMERLRLSLARAERSHKSVAVLFLDLDHFKVVNDSLGHEKGDHLLIEVGRRISSCLRPGDTAARFGGDEFAILLEDVAGVKDATLVAGRIEQSLQAPFDLDGREVEVAASVGIVLSTRGQDRAEDLLRKADVAMYRAKNNGRAQYEVFDTKVSALALERLEMEIDLRQSIKRRQLRLYYQPLVDLQTGRIIGLEALLRWQHPTRGLVPPFEFIALAEDTRMVLPIGHWVLREACSQIRQWQQEFPWEVPLEVSINLSARQFQDPQLAPDIARVLRETGLPAQCLELEIIESTVMEDAQTTVTQLETLKKLGVQLAVDDFGTGYSSLSYLERFPLDTLKIDRAFVSRINEETGTGPASGGAVVRAVCTLGQALDMRVTAEGIETRSQLQHLRNLGCHVGQGYFFARPLPAEEVAELLRKNPRW